MKVNNRWNKTKLKFLAKMQMGPTILKKDLSEGGIPVFSAGNQEQKWGYINKNVKQFPRGVLVVSARGTIGVPKLPQDEVFTCTQTTIAISADDSLDVKYLYYFILSVRWNDIVSGVAIPMLTIAILGEIDIILPPLEEQKRIVETLDSILPKVRQLKTRFEKIPILLKKFRQSVLSAAFIGQLTEDWRRSADFVYQRRKIADLVESIKYGTSAKCTREPTGIPILRIPNVQSGYINPTDLKYAELNDKDKSGLKLSEGDLLLVRSNGSVDLVGRTAIVRSEDTNYGYAGYLMRLRLKKDIVYPGFLNLYFQSYDMRLQIELPARSTTGVHNINSKEVMNLELNLPCFAEQQEIVKIVTKLFGLLDYCEKKCKNALSFIDKIEQSILSNVFNGNF
ncbi:MAG: restriction endonuclease subunit S [Candidatus Cloacimonadaceae bacterium]